MPTVKEILVCKEFEPSKDSPPFNQLGSSNISPCHHWMENMCYILSVEKQEFIAFWYYLSRRNECLYLYESKHTARYKFLFLDLDTRPA